MNDDTTHPDENNAFKDELSQLVRAHSSLTWRQRAEALRWYADLAWTRSNTPDRSDAVTPPDEPIDRSHLEDVDDGCGCVEVWETMSEHRSSD